MHALTHAARHLRSRETCELSRDRLALALLQVPLMGSHWRHRSISRHASHSRVSPFLVLHVEWVFCLRRLVEQLQLPLSMFRQSSMATSCLHSDGLRVIHRDYARDSSRWRCYLPASLDGSGLPCPAAYAAACIMVHPDERHHLRCYIHYLMAHCRRGGRTFNAGNSIDLIVLRLRWKLDGRTAVRLYLCDCSIGTLTSDVL